MLFLLTDSHQKLKLEKGHGALIILFYVGWRSPPLQSRFKENAKISSKNSRKYYSFKTEFAFFIKTAKKTTALQQVTGEKIPNLVLKRKLELF